MLCFSVQSICTVRKGSACRVNLELQNLNYRYQHKFSIFGRPNLAFQNYHEFPNQGVVLQKPLVLRTFVKEAKFHRTWLQHQFSHSIYFPCLKLSRQCKNINLLFSQYLTHHVPSCFTSAV